ncbi:Phosphoribosylaminoimidazole carboxylase ATPase subunit [Thioalkalivibrio nitratireducens DSM 14787]|uniref:N5-carboxyaminoimidazole ribonucleotide synthase n=1 Tax=Thioalkalivibrio nitratireducens (strain DSM 14787 / UNIQEM 213 / ALEN2) TaxID=1255043 RepID=L0DUM9_THIND|nr:5-(carboxyamino)imidazole ribonucleotide synthase [Thioalkalivibrio nitratireducens]AGA32056.1 Phosphoribosylaminoimidazole carboxylase ATPase subunit [Thioalkalivibrio nitratireducens DSM 14787]
MILPPAILGLLGGGQLGRYVTISARTMGYRVWVLDPDPDSPAGQLADRHLCAPFDDRSALGELAANAAVITCEFENVPAASAEWLARHALLRPDPRALAVAQDRIVEKRFLEAAGVALAPWLPIDDVDAARATVPDWEFPAILKTARLGYDGKGQQPVTAPGGVVRAFRQLGEVPCVLEQKVDLEREVSVILARDPDGRCRSFPVAENVHRGGVLHVSRVPARIPESARAQAEAIAQHVAEALEYCGVLAVEFFVTGAGELLVNEIAPRPHNSGHYTLDAVTVSQFEQQLRAVCGLALAPAEPIAPVAMLNLLGDLWPADGSLPDFSRVLAQGRARLHLYGKPAARPGRKMGHLNLLGPPGDADAAQAVRLAESLWMDLAGRAGGDAR